MRRKIMVLCLFLAGCYETVSEKREREKMQQQIDRIERDVSK